MLAVYPGFQADGETMKYLPPFELIRRSIEISTVRGELRVNILYENFVTLLRQLIQGIEVDEAWYLKQNPDVADSIRNGSVSSAQEHFERDGYREGRLPFQM